MLALLTHRLLMGLLVMVVVSMLVFASTELLPGDVARAILGQGATEEAERGHLLDQFGAIPVVRLIVLEVGKDFFLRKIPGHFLHHPLFIG